MKKLRKYHHEAMQLRLAGLTYQEIADKLEKSYQTVQLWFNQDELFSAKYEKMKNDIIQENKDKLVNLAGKAIETVDRNLNCNNAHAELQAAKMVFDRIGLEAKQKIEEKTEITDNSNIKVTFSRNDTE